MKPLYCLVYTFIFMAFGALGTLIGPYLSSIGLTGQQIGVVTAAGTCTAIFASPFWGHRYSALKSRNGRHLLVAVVFCGAAVISLLLSRMDAFTGVLILFVTLCFFQSPSSSLMDTLTIDEGERFGQIRTFGAAGFAVASFGAASLADALSLKLIFPIYTACLMVAIALVLLVLRRGEEQRAAQDPDPVRLQSEDPAAAQGSEKREAVDSTVPPSVRPADSRRLREMSRALLSNRKYCLLLICAFFINGTDVSNNTYFSFLYLEGGGTLAGIGIAFLLMAGSEVPFMAASESLCNRFGQGRILLIAMVFSVIRFGLFALGLSSGLLIALFPLQGLVNGITLVEFVRFVARVIPDRLHGFGIAVYYALGSSLSTILCQLIGGRLLDCGLFGLSGPRSVYLFFALFNIAGVVIFLAAKLHRE